MKGDRPDGPIRWRLHLRSPPERVWEALDTPDGRAGFWAEEAPERDGVIRFRFGDGTVCEARVLEREPPRRLVLRYFGSRVELGLAPDGRGGTDLHLVDEGAYGEEEWIEVHAGWLNVLFPLKARVDHGVDLRSHDPDRSWEQGWIDP